MKRRPILCTQCAGPLKVVGGADHARCRYCGTELRLHRHDGEVIAEALDELRRIAAEASDRDHRREVMGELKKLKSRWMREREAYLALHGDAGEKVEPTESSGVVVLVSGVILAVFAYFVMRKENSQLTAVVVAGVALGLFSLLGFHLIQTARYFAARRRVYVRKRRAILDRLHEKPVAE